MAAGGAPLGHLKSRTCSQTPRQASGLPRRWIGLRRLSVTTGPAGSAPLGRRGPFNTCQVLILYLFWFKLGSNTHQAPGEAPSDSGIAPSDSGIAPSDSGIAPSGSGMAPSNSTNRPDRAPNGSGREGNDSGRN